MQSFENMLIIDDEQMECLNQKIMKNLFFLIFLGPFLFSQNFQTRDSLKTLAISNFKSMEVFQNKNGKLAPVRNYNYDTKKSEITIKNVSNKNKEWLRTIIKLDNNYNIKEEEKVIEGMMISEKGNTLVKLQVSMLKEYIYNNQTIQMCNFDSKGSLSTKELSFFDDKKRIIEKLILLKVPNDIVIAEIEKYNWIDDYSYDYEKQTFNFPRTKIAGVYKLNQYGEIESFKGNMTINDNTELYDYNLGKKLKQFDSKGNLIKVYTVDNGKENVLEERRIVY